MKFAYTFLTLFACLTFGCGGNDDDSTPMPSGPPTAIVIEQVTITEWPPLQVNGAEWDDGALTGLAPDIYFDVANNDLGVVVFVLPVEDRIENAQSGANLVFDDLSIQLTDPVDTEFVVRVYDFDSFNTDDFLGGVQANIYDPALPRSIILDAGVGVSITLDVSYQF